VPQSRSSQEAPSAEVSVWTPPRVGVCAAGADGQLCCRARALAEELNLPVVEQDGGDCDLLVVVSGQGLELRETGRSAAGGVRVDFGERGASGRRLASASRRQPLARAVGLKKRTPTVLDATAGLGRDAMLLARLGCPVIAVERSVILGALLRDGLERAAGVISAGGVRLVVGDAVEVLGRMSAEEAPDVVYLDPMYPRSGKSALPKKEMRVLRRLVGDDADAGALLEAARRVARERVVVKRTPRAGPLAPGPTMSIRSKLTRYDVYLTRA
jgi:16S rRNA (guanine1516-N2)-methyltransferase